MTYIKNVYLEMKKTKWPTFKESLKDFTNVILFTALILAFIALFDWAAHGIGVNLVSWLSTNVK